ncbi:MAG: SSS family solute:Na+ symporter [Planctomycetota bacterium]|jgi:SSS family solute:Na+ symporter
MSNNKFIDMSPQIILITLVSYFAFLMLIAQLTKGKSDNKTFFTGNKDSNWFLVAFGMIGASLSGVTFISIPGSVSGASFSYMQMVLGYLVGYFIIATVLIPIYYKLNLITIYTYLGKRFGSASHKTGSAFFILSRIVGAALRLYLVASVLQAFVFDYYEIPFLLTVFITIVLIWIYTFQGGIRTIVYTDTLQTFFMLSALGLSIYFISQSMDLKISGLIDLVKESDYSKTFFFDDFANNKKHFFKQFFSGALIALVMTGLDQDMMQKNLTCKNAGEAKKNIFTMSFLLVPINLLFLFLGASLYLFAQHKGFTVPERADHLFAEVAFNHLPIYAGVIFLLGLIAAAYSSADSALTSLTTTFSVDFLSLDKTQDTRKRFLVHIAFSIILMIVIFAFDQLNDDSIVWKIFKFAGYTYGPLLGLFAFGLLTKIKIKDKFVPIIAIVSPFITYIIQYYSPEYLNYTFGFELLFVNALITFVGLVLVKK